MEETILHFYPQAGQASLRSFGLAAMEQKKSSNLTILTLQNQQSLVVSR